MENIVGQTPRGENFFPRPKIINKIYRRLNAGANVYMAAPRRVGKTAIMRYLEDNPREGYEFKYIITEAVDNAATYFRRLLDALQKLKKIPKKSVEAVGNILDKIKEFEVLGVKIDLSQKNNAEHVRYFEEFKTLIKTLDTNGTKIVIMVDEFPQTIENIIRKNGAGEAEQFLQFNREIRHQINENICFIFTGSIGLPTMAEKLDATKEISDLNTVEIPPLEREEAQEFTMKLLDSAAVPYTKEAIKHLLDKIRWFIPFHIQLAVQELIDEYDNTEETLNEAIVDDAFAKITAMRNDIYFEHYYSRLKKTFDGQEHPFALAVLNELTQRDELTMRQIEELAKTHNLTNYPIVLRTLEFDGYLFNIQRKNDTFYRFTSPVLRQWWKSYVK